MTRCKAVSLPLSLLTALLALVLTVTACSSPDESENDGAPIQVNTANGPITIKGTPKRIVTIGSQWIDVVLDFGVTPVAYIDSIQVLTGKPAPWVGDRLKDATAIKTDGDIVAQVAKAKPDLVLVGNVGQLPQDTLANIGKIAPTIPPITSKQVDPWQDMVKLLGTVLRQNEKATQISTDTQAKIDAVRKRFPTLAGKTYTLAYVFTAEQIQVLADPDDGATELFKSLGMAIAPRLVSEFRKTNQARFPVSMEMVPLLNSDLLIVTAGTPQLLTGVQKLPGYRNLTSARDDAVTELSVAEISGINQPTPLALNYLLDKLTPALEKVAN